MYSQLIEAKTDYTVEQKFGLAGAAVCFDALENGEIDMFVEYTGTALMNLLAQPMATDKDESGRPSMTLWRRTTHRHLQSSGLQQHLCDEREARDRGTVQPEDPLGSN